MQQPSQKNFYYVIYLFMIGLFLGILIVNAGYDTWIRNGSLLGTEMILRLKNSVPDGGELFGYIMKHRLFTVFMLGILGTTMIGVPAVCGYVCYTGLAAGCLLSVAVIRYGIRGLLLMAAGVFPQGLLLIPAYIALFIWTLNVNRLLYVKGPYGDHYIRTGRQSYLKKGIEMISIVVVVIIGCLVESYVNPKMLHFILKIF